MKRIFIALALAISPVVSANNDVQMYGAGGNKCSSFVAAATAERSGESYVIDSYLSWAAGWSSLLSAQQNADVLNGIDGPTLKFELERYCRSFPNRYFANAVANLLARIASGELQPAAPL
ncbi:MAG: hypothetical protein CMI09_00405 [Oceanospirillaceae bacterium]|jgi:accessory colonization factor AcfC|nr:hypothetical protein [Oceanospirillaceae bacterium]|tara:strand:+ start:37138 stop:37497 length:360 start_codon:yes stop_codon:yes gene_type:complete